VGQNEERVFLYLTTGVTVEDDENNLIFLNPSKTTPTLPTDKVRGDRLATALVKSGAATGIFYVDASNKVESNAGECDMQKPLFGFRNAE